MHGKSGPYPLFTLLVFLALLLTLAAVVLSAWLRLDSIGLGCADWPACFGQLPVHDSTAAPRTAAGLVHRFTASLLGLIVVIITIQALRGRRPPGVGVVAPLAVFALTVFLSVLGYSTPSPDLPAVTFGNLTGGMAMLALLWWIGQRAVQAVGPLDSETLSLRPWLRVGLLVVVTQIALGAITSARFAGPSCTQLPGCSGHVPQLAELAQGLDLFERLAVDARGHVVTGAIEKTMHLTHRVVALCTLLYLGWLALRALSLPRLRNTALVLSCILLLQLAAGSGAVLGGLPLPLVTVHNALAALLLLAVVNLNHLATSAH